MKEIRNEQAIEALADMFDPIVEIMTDADVVSAARKDDRLTMVKLMLKKHSRAIFELLAVSEGKDPDEYECDILTLPMKLLALINRPEMSFLFPSQGQENQTSSGSATVSTKVEEN